MNKLPRKKLIISSAVLILMALWIGLCSGFTIWIGDDIDYRFFIDKSLWQSYRGINTVWDLFASQNNHYLVVNGRYVDHLLVQIFCSSFGKVAFAIANALVYIGFVLLIVRLSGARFVNVKAVITAVVLVLLTFVTKMMPTCQIGYVWMFALVLTWYTLYCRLSRSATTAWWLIVCAFVLSVAAGNSQEALSLSLGVALFVECAIVRFRLRPVQWAMLIGYAAGLSALCFAPSTLSRASGLNISIGESLLMMCLSLRATYIMICVVGWALWRRRLTLSTVYKDNRLWINTMLVAFVFNLYVGVYCNRQLFGVELCAILVTMRVLRRHAMPYAWMVAIGAATVALMVAQALWIADSRAQYNDIVMLYKKSHRGIVFYDRHRSSSSIQALIGRYNENVIGAGHSDVTHSLAKDLLVEHPGNEYPVVYPVALKDLGLEATPDKLNFVIEYYPEHFVVVTDTLRPHTIVIHRELNVPYVHVPLSNDTLPANWRNVRKGANYRTHLIIPDAPWARITSVTLD